MKKNAAIRSSPNHFCSLSCSGSNIQKNKNHVVTVSKIEKWIQSRLVVIYPNLEFHFNRKDKINSELDIFVPTLMIAFELNGPFHYEPIYGLETLRKIQNNDSRRFQACLETGVELCIIDISVIRRAFKPERGQWVLDIIIRIIDDKLAKEHDDA